jgi:cysteine desulfurase
MIYLDYNATTPVDDQVISKMLPYFATQFANAASSHEMGHQANDAVEEARSMVAELVATKRGEVYFTSGATEANNLALRGILPQLLPTRQRVLVGTTEHRAVLDTAHRLRASGAAVEEVPVSSDGLIDEDSYVAMLDDRVGLVSIMWANNETGVIAPIARLAELAHRVGAIFHCDATQAAGKVPLDLRSAGVDLASLSAHKLYGPKGVGALYVHRGLHIEAQMSGGGHERGMRSGTLNVPGIVGFGEAARIAMESIDGDQERLRSLSSRLVAELRLRIGDVRVIGEGAPRLPNTVNLRMVGADSEAVMANAANVAISSGSACTALVPEVSHVLLAMGLRPDQAEECLRFSLGRYTTAQEVDSAALQVADAVRRVRRLTA